MEKYLKSLQLRTVFYNTIRSVIEDVREKRHNIDDPITLHRYCGEKAMELLKDITIRFNLKEK